MLYIFKEGRFIRRGSPPAPTEAGVYAYTKVCNFSKLCLKSFRLCLDVTFLFNEQLDESAVMILMLLNWSICFKGTIKKNSFEHAKVIIGHNNWVIAQS